MSCLARIVSLCIVTSSGTVVTACALDRDADPTADALGDAIAPAAPAAPDGDPPGPADWKLINASACPLGFVCLYQNADGSGMMLALAGGVSIANMATISCPGCPGGTFDNQTSALNNRTGRQYCWYDNPLFLPPGHSIASNAVVILPPGPADNTLSSIRPC